MGSEEKPTTAFVLSLVAGVLILIGGIASLIASFFFARIVDRWTAGQPGFPMMIPQWIGGVGTVLSVIGVVFGAIVIYSALMLNSAPRNHATWGTLILVFSILSIIGAWAGFGIGLILGIIGGALAINWKPSAPITTVAPQVTSRFCAQCGKAIPLDAKFCPYCGKEAPI